MPRASFRHRCILGSFLALIVTVFLVGGPVTFRADMLQTFVALTCVVGLAAGSWVGDRERRVLRLGGSATLAAALVAWSCATEFWATEAGELHLYQLAKLISLGILALVVATEPDILTPRVIARSLAFGLVALLSWVLAGAFLDWHSVGWRFRPPWTAGFGNQNILAGTVAVAVVLCAGLAMSETPSPARRWQALYAAAVVAGGALVWGTESRIAIFATLGGGALLLVLRSHVILRQSISRALIAYAAYGLGCLALLSMSSERFHDKMVTLATGGGRSESARLFFWNVAWDRLVESPTHLLFGYGFSSFSHAYHSVNPKSQGYFWQKVGTEFLHNELLEWWHDAGLVAVGLAIALLAGRGWSLWRHVIDRDAPVPDRGVSLALLASLATWIALAGFTVATRYVGVQVLVAIVFGLCWRDLRSRTITIRRPAVAALAVALASAATLVAFVHFRSDRLLALSHQARLDTESSTRSEELAQRALDWHPRNPYAAYALLQNAGRRGDFETAREAYETLRRDTPHFQDADAVYAHVLASEGRYAEAARLLRAFQRVAPFEYESLASLPVFAFAAGDRELLGDALLELIEDAIRGLNHETGSTHRTRWDADESGPILVVEPESERSAFRIPRGAAAGVILGREPADLADGRRLVRSGIDRLLEVELGAERRVMGAEP